MINVKLQLIEKVHNKAKQNKEKVEHDSKVLLMKLNPAIMMYVYDNYAK